MVFDDELFDKFRKMMERIFSDDFFNADGDGVNIFKTPYKDTWNYGYSMTVKDGEITDFKEWGTDIPEREILNGKQRIKVENLGKKTIITLKARGVDDIDVSYEKNNIFIKGDGLNEVVEVTFNTKRIKKMEKEKVDDVWIITLHKKSDSKKKIKIKGE